MRLPYTFIPIFFWSMVLGCQSEKPVEANLYVRYDQSELKIKAEAHFQKETEDGSMTSVVFQNGVAFINSGMNTLTLPGNLVRYGFEQIGRLPGNISFRIKDEDGKEQVFSTKLLGIESFQAKDSVLSKSNGGAITLDAKPLEPSEKLVLLVTDANRQTASFEFANLEGRTEINIAPGVLINLATGTAQLYIVRVRTENTRQGKYLVKANTEYYSDSRLFAIGE